MTKPGPTRIKKPIYIFLGLLFLVLAYFGILLPGVPAIPFILLASFFFSNSSERLQNWMLRQKLIARILARTQSKKGKLGLKLFVISQLWVSVIVACFLFAGSVTAVIGLVLAGMAGSVAMYVLMGR